jgi:thymidine phosphorylase
MLAAQGADLPACNEKLRRDSTAKVVSPVTAPKAGFVSRCNARIIGEVIRDLGGGRLTQDASVNYDVGVDQLAKPGERVARGGVLCRVHAADPTQAAAAAARLQTAFHLTAKRIQPAPLVVEIIS